MMSLAPFRDVDTRGRSTLLNRPTRVSGGDGRIRTAVQNQAHH